MLDQINTTAPLHLLRLPQVIERTALGRSTLYDRIAAGTFPAPVPLTATARAWRSDEVDAWIEARTAERDARDGAA